MITRFDHAVVAVPDLERAIEVYRRLGFEVSAGGRHPSIGTRNAIIRFGLDYLELLAVEAPEVARSSGSFGTELAAIIETGPGLAGFALASARLEDEAAGLDGAGVLYDGPFAMERERPDGRRLAWRLLVPGQSPWRKPWPFLIEWETADAERLAWDGAGHHRNGITGINGVELLVDDLASARRFYEEGLGLKPVGVQARACRYELADFALHVSAALDPAMTRELGERGPGPFRLLLASDDLSRTVDVCGGEISGDGAGACLDIVPAVALGARLRVSGR